MSLLIRIIYYVHKKAFIQLFFSMKLTTFACYFYETNRKNIVNYEKNSSQYA